MEPTIASLSTDQAQRAVMIFCDLVPADFWENGARPSPAKIEWTVEKFEDNAPPEARPIVEALSTDGTDEQKGEIAKALLSTFHEQESLSGFVEQAVEQAQQPHLSPLPLIVGALTLVLLSGVRLEVGGGKVGLKIGTTANIKALTGGIANIVKQIPKPTLEKLFPKLLQYFGT